MTERILVRTNEKVSHRIRPTTNTKHRFLSENEKTKNLVRSPESTKHNVITEGRQGPEGVKGDSAYKAALDEGFVGTKEEWLESLVGKSAYQIALDNGFVGSKEEWLDFLVNTPDITSEDIGKFLSASENGLLWIDITKEYIGLGNVDNTSDMDKPISHAQQNALDMKLDKAQFRPRLESEINNTNNILLLDHGEF